MQVIDPNTIKLTESTTQLIKSVLDEYDILEDLGQFSDEVLADMRSEFLPRRISDTLNIEGVRVNPRITRAVLEGLSLSEADRYNEREVLNVIDANDFIEEHAQPEQQVTPEFIRELHRRVMSDLHQEAGVFRPGGVQITGAESQPPPAGDVLDLLREMCGMYSRAVVNPVLRATWLHATFTRIHPFSDGNGRVGRLLQDFSLISGGLLPVGIPAARRGEYYEALEGADRDTWDDLVSIVSAAEVAVLDKAIRIARKPVARRERLKSLYERARQTRRRTEHARYEVWRRQIDSLVDEFAAIVDELEDLGESSDVQFKIRTYDPLSFDKWKDILHRGWSTATWILTIETYANRSGILQFLFFARGHDFRRTIDWEDLPYNTPAVFITGTPFGEKFDLISPWKDRYIRLREILPYNGRLSAYRDPTVHAAESVTLAQDVEAELASTGKWRVEDEARIEDIATEFFEDAFAKMGLT